MSRMPVYVVVRTPHSDAGAQWIDGCFFFHFLTGLGRPKSHGHRNPTLPAPISVVPPHLLHCTTQFSSPTVKMLAVKPKPWRSLLGVWGTATAAVRVYAIGRCVFSSQRGTRVLSSPLYRSDFARCCTPQQLF
ncbi:Piso0_004261 [Millerozyma farinosa CBS 7064]|uniref:Piso0_004261 protein n=1 Tax=Pichia sorbitophila (strain ATCC MYA-4447 / BCRC 22081 / CBS 7064 / NBRC 10061 / NRRL Y-12695) TaxID=559304 RepID=G8YB12_PICSO|nr:Piso0_004261 [Millerozyma farinosa CBS 7064]CCE84707.1 Piso0_004261 [Millerozyma farinosa CBS 7064]